jgi:hypothetical protein
MEMTDMALSDEQLEVVVGGTKKPKVFIADDGYQVVLSDGQSQVIIRPTEGWVIQAPWIDKNGKPHEGAIYKVKPNK